MTQDDEYCPTCKNTYLVACPSHMVETDEDGWCLTCDTSYEKPQPVPCHCQAD